MSDKLLEIRKDHVRCDPLTLGSRPIPFYEGWVALLPLLYFIGLSNAFPGYISSFSSRMPIPIPRDVEGEGYRDELLEIRKDDKKKTIPGGEEIKQTR